MLILGLEVGLDLAFDLVSSQKLSHEYIHLHYFQGALVVSVDGVVDVLAHLSELVDIHQDVSQVLDRLLIVNNYLCSFHVGLL